MPLPASLPPTPGGRRPESRWDRQSAAPLAARVAACAPGGVLAHTAAWVVICLLTLTAGCDRPPASPNLLLLSIDTLRADHLGCYGYGRDTSPHLDRLAASSTRYANARAPAPSTLPSHAALFSGRHPFELGLTDYGATLPESVPLLAELLASGGYDTAALVDSSPGGMLGADHGFDRGFGSYRHAPHTSASPYRYDMASTVDTALQWLGERHDEQPFFLFLHTKSVHTAPADAELLARSTAPYAKPEPYASRFVPGGRQRFAWRDGQGNAGVRYLRALNESIAAGRFDRSSFEDDRLAELIGLYDGGIAYVDDQLQRLLDGLADLGLAANTVLLITADHGEGFLEHHFLLHKEPVDELLAVPLIVHDPRRPQGAVIEHPVTLMDVAPTLLTMAGLPLPADLAGRPLPGLTSTATERPAREEQFSYYHFDQDGLYEAYSLARGPWRLMYHRLAHWDDFRVELFARRDGATLPEPVEDRPELRQALLGRLLEQLRREPRTGAAPRALDEQTQQQLRALGYLK